MRKIPESVGLMIASLYEEAANMQKQSDLLASESQDLRYQAKEIENQYEFQGPCIGCPRYKTCNLSGSCGAMDQCRMARELAGVSE
jgi:hypothetical protein